MIAGEKRRVAVDLVVLATGMVPTTADQRIPGPRRRLRPLWLRAGEPPRRHHRRRRRQTARGRRLQRARRHRRRPQSQPGRPPPMTTADTGPGDGNGAAPPISVYVCSGCSLGERLNLDQLAQLAQDEAQPARQRPSPLCIPEGFEALRRDIAQTGARKTLIAACSPRGQLGRLLPRLPRRRPRGAGQHPRAGGLEQARRRRGDPGPRRRLPPHGHRRPPRDRKAPPDPALRGDHPARRRRRRHRPHRRPGSRRRRPRRRPRRTTAAPGRLDGPLLQALPHPPALHRVGGDRPGGPDPRRPGSTPASASSPNAELTELSGEPGAFPRPHPPRRRAQQRPRRRRRPRHRLATARHQLPRPPRRRPLPRRDHQPGLGAPRRRRPHHPPLQRPPREQRRLRPAPPPTRGAPLLPRRRGA